MTRQCFNVVHFSSGWGLVGGASNQPLTKKDEIELLEQVCSKQGLMFINRSQEAMTSHFLPHSSCLSAVSCGANVERALIFMKSNPVFSDVPSFMEAYQSTG